ncbi:MAG: class I SAM-dependent methyltransferase [Candidatus Diapherotrites archaeon]|nr:class I SAM-dependent methyltransferase [Candidatus Diapherotrites archaeon]
MPRPKTRFNDSIRIGALRGRVQAYLKRLPPELSPQEVLRESQITAELPEGFLRRQRQGLNPRDLGKKVLRQIPKRERRGYWNRLSSKWSQIENRGVFEVTIDAIIRNTNFMPHDRIVSLGSGSGVIETFLAKEIVPQGKVTLVDTAEHMNREARKLAQREGAGNIRFVTGEMERIPIASNSYDVVMSINSIQWVQAWPKTISEIRRVLKKNEDSRAVISVHTLQDQHTFADWGEQELVQELKRQGFEPLFATRFIGKGQAGNMTLRSVVIAKLDFAQNPRTGAKSSAKKGKNRGKRGRK